MYLVFIFRLQLAISPLQQFIGDFYHTANALVSLLIVMVLCTSFFWIVAVIVWVDGYNTSIYKEEDVPRYCVFVFTSVWNVLFVRAVARWCGPYLRFFSHGKSVRYSGFGQFWGALRGGPSFLRRAWTVQSVDRTHCVYSSGILITRYCVAEINDLVAFSAGGFDFVITGIYTFLLYKSLRTVLNTITIHELTMGKHAIMEHILMKTFVLGCVAVSTTVFLSLLYVSLWESPLIISLDTIINSSCVLLMSTWYQPYYDVSCAPCHRLAS